MTETSVIKLGGQRAAEPRILGSGVRVLSGIEYATVRGFRPLLLDLYLPVRMDRAPSVVFIHGGGWGLGTRASVAPTLETLEPGMFERLASAGVVVATVDYRLTGEAIFPAQLHDVKAAVRWLRSQADPLGIDPQGIVAWGASAGGHLAALVGLTADQAALEGDVGVADVSSAVCGVVDWYGPTDLVALVDQGDPAGPMEHDSEHSPEGSLIGAVVSLNPDRARVASPIAYVHAGAPPFQIKHGSADRAVPPVQSEALAKALSEVGVRADLEIVDGSDHMWIGAGDVEAIVQSSLEFVLEVTAR